MAYPLIYNLLMERPLDPRIETVTAPWRDNGQIPTSEQMAQLKDIMREIAQERGISSSFQ